MGTSHRSPQITFSFGCTAYDLSLFLSPLQSSCKTLQTLLAPIQLGPTPTVYTFVCASTLLPGSKLVGLPFALLFWNSKSPSWASNYPPRLSALLARYSSPAGIPPESFSSTPYFPVRNLHNPVLGSLGTTSAVRPSVCSHVLAPNDPSSLHTVSTTNIILN